MKLRDGHAVRWSKLWPELEDLPAVTWRDERLVRSIAPAVRARGADTKGMSALDIAGKVRATVPPRRERAAYLVDWYTNVKCFTTVARKATRENDVSALEPTDNVHSDPICSEHLGVLRLCMLDLHAVSWLCA